MEDYTNNQHVIFNKHTKVFEFTLRNDIMKSIYAMHAESEMFAEIALISRSRIIGDFHFIVGYDLIFLRLSKHKQVLL